MDEKKTREFFEALRKIAAQTTEDLILQEDAEGNVTLRAGFTTMVDGGGPCLFETQLYEAWEGETQVEIIVSPQFEIHADCMEDFEVAITYINLFSPLGYFGIFYPEDQMYYRYNGFLNVEEEAPLIAEGVYHLFERIAMVVGNVHEALEKIATGVSTFDEEVEKGVLPSQEAE